MSYQATLTNKKLQIFLIKFKLSSKINDAFQAWSQPNYHGAAKTYTHRGTFRPGYTIKSYKWDSPIWDDCCVRMCNGNRNVGYYCSSHSSGQPSANFNKVVIGCGNEQLIC
ncbi:fungal-specific transcription factor domain-containing protein [Rhizophagus irregularis DAOM 181602=DAOM 197198]|nr:fungal-specific transcription factor domain-containing protein [Rhizophagus irregularis DAOM 181602=DAOM 197198]